MTGATDYERGEVVTVVARVILCAASLYAASPAAAGSVPEFWGDGIHDDADALQAIFDGCPVVNRSAGEMLISAGPRVRGAADVTATYIHGARIRLGHQVDALRRSGVVWAIVDSKVIAADGSESIIGTVSARQLLDGASPSPCEGPEV